MDENLTIARQRGIRWLPLVLGLLLPVAAFAHARLERSTPANKAQLSAAPERIELWFNELLDDSFNSIEVFDAKAPPAPKRANLAKGKPEVDKNDRTHLSISVETLAPGDYVVEWRVLSRDGHSAPGKFTFSIVAPK